MPVPTTPEDRLKLKKIPDTKSMAAVADRAENAAKIRHKFPDSEVRILLYKGRCAITKI